MDELEHRAPWWFRFAMGLCPERCREIPEARDPGRIVLRQVAIIKRYLYLQQFASSEDVRWAHSHQWRWTIALGLWGHYVERRLPDHWVRIRRAPYLYVMGSDVIHQVYSPSAGHTSLFLGLWRNDDLKRYYLKPAQSRSWEDHIKVKVKRI